MATPPNHAPPPHRDARRHGDPIALLSALTRQRGSEDSLDTLEMIWAVLRDMDSVPAITHVLRALQEMAAAGAFTPVERFYLVTELGELLVSRRIAQQPRLHEALGEQVAIDKRYGADTLGRGRPEPGASEYERLRLEIESITLTQRAATFESLGETEIASLLLQGSDQFEALREQGRDALAGWSADEPVSDPATGVANFVAFLERSSPDDLLFYLIDMKGQPRATFVWSAYRDLPEPDDTLQDHLLLVRPLQRAADKGTFTPDERHFLLADLAERLAPLPALEELDRARRDLRQEQLREEPGAASDDERAAPSPLVVMVERTLAFGELSTAFGAEWLQSVGEPEMAHLLTDDHEEYDARRERGCSSLFSLPWSEWEAMQEGR